MLICMLNGEIWWWCWKMAYQLISSLNLWNEAKYLENRRNVQNVINRWKTRILRILCRNVPKMPRNSPFWADLRAFFGRLTTDWSWNLKKWEMTYFYKIWWKIMKKEEMSHLFLLDDDIWLKIEWNDGNWRIIGVWNEKLDDNWKSKHDGPWCVKLGSQGLSKHQLTWNERRFH